MLVRVCVLVLKMLTVTCTPVVAFVGRRSRNRRQCHIDIFPPAATSDSISPLDADDACPCFWYEDPAETQRFTAPFGRAQKGVEERLQTLNWQRLQTPTQQIKCHGEEQESRVVPSFTFKYAGAPTFCAYHPGIPGPIRQIPASWDWDSHIDDKLRLHLLLSANSTKTCHDMTPPTFVVDHALLSSLDEGQDNQGLACISEAHWFLKHRLDSKRPRVHPYGSNAELCRRLRQMKERSWKYYIVQKEIHPAMLIRGRKFVLRAHVLAWVHGGTLDLFLHDNPLVSENEKHFVTGDDDDASGGQDAWASQAVSALVLQSGSRSASYLLTESEELTSYLRASILEQISSIVAIVFRELINQHPFPLDLQHNSQYEQLSSDGSVYQLYGLDFMLNSSGKVFLLEVNRSPRIATGAMGDVHECYTELLGQAMHILGVAKDASSDGELPKSGRFGAWKDVYHATL